MYKKVEVVCKAFGLVAFFILMQYSIMALFKIGIELKGVPFQSYYETHLYLINGTIQASYLFILLIVDKLKKEDLKQVFGLMVSQKWISYIGYGIGLWMLSTLLNAFLLPFFEEYGTHISQLFANNERVLRFINLIILAPFVEEYLFRYKIQEVLKKGFGPTLAIIFQGVLFGLIHAIALQKIYAIVLGIGLGFIREKEKHLQSSIIAHMTINSIGFLVGTFLIS
ncbi:hypothetical protein CS063_04320 [Sporanaerobium hydrogeniformans]|uniref:Uncharacterized protein n=1 Tax=Sporanaerobium hydrogeniformans TaxID=3072179 RepID=A0AC61DG41_9FIRM|nr:CPBP family intramembrane glutamic endopeptidase [Sporanaerobium hydrogeniformans]PHV71788.1 hypothetical protein CS063_04320 [Sporanaerobium hydrogeniformans]